MPDLSQAGAPQEKKKGKGCLIAAVIAVIILIIGIVAVVGLGMWGWSKVKDRIATDPAKVVAMSNKIATIDIGDTWSPVFGMDIVVMRMALYTSGAEAEQGMLFLMDGDASMGSGDAFEAQMRSKMEEQTSKQSNKLEATKQISSARQDFMIRGKPTGFLVVTSEGVDTGAKYLEISGSFETNQPGRTGFLYIRAPESSLTIDQAKAIIESIN